MGDEIRVLIADDDGENCRRVDRPGARATRAIVVSTCMSVIVLLGMLLHGALISFFRELLGGG